jgi:butyryl-CoA dehydrogenase
VARELPGEPDDGDQGARLSGRQRELRSRSRQVAVDVLRDVKTAAEGLPSPQERFAATKPAYEKLVADGLLRACLPRSAGGDSQGLLDTAIVAEELYCGNPSVALTLLGTVLGLQPVLAGGTGEQQQRLLAPFLSGAGAPLAAFCSSEPGGGLRSYAYRHGDHWIINGRKKWVSSATGWDGKGADLLCVVCRTDRQAPPEQGASVIVVEKPAEGIVLERVIDSPGYRAHLLPEFSLHDVTASAQNLLGREGAGLALSGQSFTGAAAPVGVFGVALLRSAFDHTLRFARTERRGGSGPVIEHQAVGYALADAKTSIEAARALSWRACRAVDAGHPAAPELANHAKIFGSETAVRVITDLMRVVGVDSYDDADPLNGLLQDALALPLLAGGNAGVRRRALHALLQSPGYNPLSAADAV